MHCYLPHADADIFPNVTVLIEIGCVFPVSISETERSFSALTRIKTQGRTQDFGKGGYI